LGPLVHDAIVIIIVIDVNNHNETSISNNSINSIKLKCSAKQQHLLNSRNWKPFCEYQLLVAALVVHPQPVSTAFPGEQPGMTQETGAWKTYSMLRARCF
jgi:hypothetical protein